MTHYRRLPLVAAAFTLLGLANPGALSPQVASDHEAAVDRIFQRWTNTTPGCAVGVSIDGRTMLSKAYGMADLEHDVKNTPDTIFEAGSVSKQFTAAAVLLLAMDGKLSLDDPARKHVPELPDYGQPLTIRHMLTHTSGLRDWGSVVGIAGAPRTTRVYTHAHVLDVVSKQKALNFPPGTKWSYSNTGYNLAAIIVSRVSGMSFADFTRHRIFEPLGMSHTSWRDDHGRIVKNRAMAYVHTDGVYRTRMPFENVHGNGGLLTTVGDLLKWNRQFVSPAIGDRTFVEQQERPGQFVDGRPHGYALGLQVGTYQGVRQIAHGGATAGYRAYLSRYPQARVSIALLCNAGNVVPNEVEEAIAQIYLARHLTDSTPPARHTLSAAEVDELAGNYRHAATGRPLTIVPDGSGLRLERGPGLIPMSSTRLMTTGGEVFERTGSGLARLTDRFGTVDSYRRVTAPAPTVAELAEFAGVYTSDEAEVALTFTVMNDKLILRRRPDTSLELTPLDVDAFISGIGTVIFRRELGRVTEVSIAQERVWDLRFVRQPTQDSSIR